MDGGVYLIYLLRTMRLVYAHEVDASRSKIWIFKLFKHEYYLVFVTVIVMLIKVIPIIFNDWTTYNFYTFL
jgi:hypothetical protein